MARPEFFVIFHRFPGPFVIVIVLTGEGKRPRRKDNSCRLNEVVDLREKESSCFSLVLYRHTET